MRGGDRLIERAFAFAVDKHGEQTRKGTTIPYISHPMAVAALVLEDAGTDEDAAAALLHDILEDTETTVEEVREGFGPYVARIVQACSDSLSSGDRPPWRQRKETYIARLPEQPGEVLRVSVADKLHNARSILEDVRRDGVASLDRFTGGREGVLWYYGTLVETYRSARACTSRWLPELERVVAELHDRATGQEDDLDATGGEGGAGHGGDVRDR